MCGPLCESFESFESFGLISLAICQKIEFHLRYVALGVGRRLHSIDAPQQLLIQKPSDIASVPAVEVLFYPGLNLKAVIDLVDAARKAADVNWAGIQGSHGPRPTILFRDHVLPRIRTMMHKSAGRFITITD